MSDSQFEAESSRRAELRKCLERVLHSMVENGLVDAGKVTDWGACSDRELAIYAASKTAELARRWVLEDIEERTRLEKVA